MKHKRQKVPFKQRIKPCVVCDYPLSQQHHIFPIAIYGSNSQTIPLCANCHELYHLIESVYLRNSKRGTATLAHLLILDKKETNSSICGIANYIMFVARDIDEDVYRRGPTNMTYVYLFRKCPDLYALVTNALSRRRLPGMDCDS